MAPSVTSAMDKARKRNFETALFEGVLPNSWETVSLVTVFTTLVSGLDNGRILGIACLREYQRLRVNFAPEDDPIMKSADPYCLLEYNATDNSVDFITSIKDRREQFTPVCIDDKIYFVGGMDSPLHISIAGQGLMDFDECYDLTTGTWSKIRAMPTRRAHAGYGVIDRKLYVVGGHTGPDEATSVLEMYDPQQDVWTKLRSLQHGRVYFAAVEGIGEELFVMGGEDGKQRQWRECWAFHSKRKVWRELPKMQVPVTFRASVAIGNKIIMMGGESFCSRAADPESASSIGTAGPGVASINNNSNNNNNNNNSSSGNSTTDGSMIPTATAASSSSSSSSPWVNWVDLYDTERSHWTKLPSLKFSDVETVSNAVFCNGYLYVCRTNGPMHRIALPSILRGHVLCPKALKSIKLPPVPAEFCNLSSVTKLRHWIEKNRRRKDDVRDSNMAWLESLDNMQKSVFSKVWEMHQEIGRELAADEERWNDSKEKIQAEIGDIDSFVDSQLQGVQNIINSLAESEAAAAAAAAASSTATGVSGTAVARSGSIVDSTHAGRSKRVFEQSREQDPPSDLVCPITYSIMTDPVVAADGHTYERSAIEEYFRTAREVGEAIKSPLTREPLHHLNLTTTILVRRLCREWFEHHNKKSTDCGSAGACRSPSKKGKTGL